MKNLKDLALITMAVVVIVILIGSFFWLLSKPREPMEVEKEVTRIVKETVVVEKEITVPIKETVIVEKEVEKEVTRIVEKQVGCETPTPQPTTATVKATIATAGSPGTDNLYILYKDVRNQSPKPEIAFGEGSAWSPKTWDGKANGFVSRIYIPKGASATFEFEWWGGSNYSELIESYTVTWGAGDYNLQEIFYPSGKRDLNDTLQRVIVHKGNVMLHEHDVKPYGLRIELN